MQYSIALSIAAVAVGVSAQGVESGITPEGGIPQGCQLSPPGSYLIKYEQPPTAAGKRSLEKRQDSCGAPDALVVKLQNGILTDKQGRIGAIVANRQFQFDGPPAQTGSVYTGGFSLCANGSIAIGPNYNFYQSLSGTFYNIYDTKQRDDNILVNMNVIPCSGNSGSSASASGAASVQPDGQPTASQAPVASQQPDGQPTAGPAPTAAASQISDGQVQATSAAASQISDGQVQATAAPNATVTSPQPPIATGGAAALAGSGLVVAIGAAVALFL